MRGKAKSLKNERKSALEKARSLLAEHFECGLVLCSWESEGETYQMNAKWGNDYAVENLSEKTNSILFPLPPDESEAEDEG